MAPSKAKVPCWDAGQAEGGDVCRAAHRGHDLEGHGESSATVQLQIFLVPLALLVVCVIVYEVLRYVVNRLDSETSSFDHETTATEELDRSDLPRYETLFPDDSPPPTFEEATKFDGDNVT